MGHLETLLYHLATPVQAAAPVPILPNLHLQSDTTFADVANHILNLMLAIALPLAFVAILYSAFILLTSGGKPEAYAQVKKNVIYLLTGFFLIIFSTIILRFVLTLFR